MTAKHQHLFECPECNQHPKEAFDIFKETECWLIAYPEKNLLHIHFGHPAHSSEDYNQEAKFNLDWLKKITKKYPDKKFCFIVDMSRKDSSEAPTSESRKIFKEIRENPQLDLGIIYGLTPGMRVIIKALMFIGGVETKVVNNYKEADVAYQKWFREFKK